MCMEMSFPTPIPSLRTEVVITFLQTYLVLALFRCGKKVRTTQRHPRCSLVESVVPVLHLLSRHSLPKASRTLVLNSGTATMLLAT